MMKKKGQGALEFLTTYGWAFLVILIMIGALGYFGILNPTRFLPERCSTNPEFSCEEFALVRQGDNHLRFAVVLKNSLGQAITLQDSVRISSDVLNNTDDGRVLDLELTSSTEAPTDQGCTVASISVSADQDFTINCRIENTGDIAVTLARSGSKLKVNADLQYIPQGRKLTRPISVEMFGTLQD